MTTVQGKWVRFKQFFQKSHQELRETSDLTVEYPGMHHVNMVSDVVAVLQEILQQERSLTNNATTVMEPVYHVENSVQSTQQQLATQLHQMQAMQMQYAAVPHHFHQ